MSLAVEERELRNAKASRRGDNGEESGARKRCAGRTQMLVEKFTIKFIILIAAIAVIALSVMAIGFLSVSFPGYNYGPKVEFRIEKGDGLNTITNHLSDAGLIRSRLAFKGYAVVSGKDKSLQAGHYKLDSNMSVRNLVNIFASGLVEDQSIGVTIPEGSNINDIDLIFTAAGLAKKGDFLKSDIVGREGFLFPDTYKFLPGITDAEVIKKMADNFVERTKNIELIDKEKIVIIASILEKEVKTKEYMALVAGIIEKRLALGMPLQLDATVAYGECRPKFLAGLNCEVKDVNLIEGIKHLESYNTYRYKGLPPGPISNPGLNAIRAALNPAASNYLYYLTDKDGNVHYAKTFAEHQQNRQKYLNK